MTAIQAYVLAKKVAESAATGIANITFKDNTLIFDLQDGQQHGCPSAKRWCFDY